MKVLLLAGVGLVALAASGYARIGEDEKQIEARYGKAAKDLGTRGGVHEVGYIWNGFMVLVDYVNGVSQREGFTKPDASALTDQNIMEILAMSAVEETSWQEAAGVKGDKVWVRSDNKMRAVLPSMGKFLYIQDVAFTQPK